jgi:hypothetical protein
VTVILSEITAFLSPSTNSVGGIHSSMRIYFKEKPEVPDTTKRSPVGKGLLRFLPDIVKARYVRHVLQPLDMNQLLLLD